MPTLRPAAALPLFRAPNDGRSHGPDERVSVATLDPGVRQWETLLRTLLN